MSKGFDTSTQGKNIAIGKSAEPKPTSSTSKDRSVSHNLSHIDKKARFEKNPGPTQKPVNIPRPSVASRQLENLNLSSNAGQFLHPDSDLHPPQAQVTSSGPSFEPVVAPIYAATASKKIKPLGARGFANMDLRTDGEELRPTPRRPIVRRDSVDSVDSSSAEVSSPQNLSSIIHQSQIDGVLVYLSAPNFSLHVRLCTIPTTFPQIPISHILYEPS